MENLRNFTTRTTDNRLTQKKVLEEINLLINSMMQNMSDFSTVLRQRVFHLDLKGAPPKPDFYLVLFPLLKRLRITHVLMEYEDMFPYSDGLELLRHKNSYDENELTNILQLAFENDLEVIPLIQTFGHMEFVLKNSIFSSLREMPTATDTICPSDERSIKLIREMLTQVRKFHPNSKIIHIGADEAYYVARDERCIHRLRTEFNNTVDRLLLNHITRIARIAKEELHFEKVWAWNDMFQRVSVDLMLESQIGELVVPVIWGYAPDVTSPDYFPIGMFDRFSQVFNEMVFAGAFKGANGATQTFLDAKLYLSNLISYYKLYEKFKVQLTDRLSGMVLTGWQRYSHNQPLCELLPVGMPSLIKESLYLADWSNVEKGADLKDKTFLEFMNCKEEAFNPDTLKPIQYYDRVFYPPIEKLYSYCKFPGSELFAKIEELRLIRWKSHVIYGFDVILKEELSQLALEVKPLLEEYFYDDTVTEWMKANMEPIFVQTQ